MTRLPLRIGRKCRAKEQEFEIKELRCEKEKSSSRQLSDRPSNDRPPLESSATEQARVQGR